MDLVNRIPVSNPMRARGLALKAVAEESRLRDLLAQADMLAARGNYSAALGTLKAFPTTGPWGELRHLREDEWNGAIAARKALTLDDARPKPPEPPKPKAKPAPEHHSAPTPKRRHRHRY